MRRRTISRERFAELKAGDLVLWNGYRLRTVQEGPGDKGRNARAMCITFSKIRPSWTAHASTVYCYNDVCRIIKPVGKKIRGLMLKSELAALKGIGFDVREALRREIRLAESVGRERCRAFDRLVRLAARV